MGRSRLVPLLFAALAVPSLALGWLGWRAYRGEAERVRTSFRERAEAAADAGRDALTRALGRVGRGEGGALAWRAGPDGELIEPEAARERVLRASAPRDAALWRFAEAEADQLEHEGRTAELRARLDGLAARDDDPWLAAWALTVRAAVEEQAGERAAADTARRELIERFPRERDERGLVRSFAARLALAERAASEALGGGDAALIALYADVVEDHAASDETATAAFKRVLAERLRTSGDAQVATIAGRDAERGRARRLRDAWRAGAADWLARGAPGGACAVALPPDSLDASQRGATWVVALDAGANPPAGGALTLRELADAALADPAVAAYTELGFALRVAGADGAVLAGAGGGAGGSDSGAGSGASELPPALARRETRLGPSDSPGAPASLEITAHGLDAEGFLASERTGFLLVAGFVVLALAVSGVAALATVRAVAREVEAARGREAFVAAVTHELKAPLASIRLLAEVLAQGDVAEEKVREFGRRTMGESDRLARLVTSVLELAKIEHGGGAPRELAPIDLNEVARAAVRTLEPLALERGFALVLREAPAPVLVRAEAGALEGALVNLLDNALKYSDAPHPIEVVVDGLGEAASVRVLDRGRGVPADDAPAIFEPFRRVGDELTRDRPGVGLGLALVREIAAAHGGRASYAARDGGGSEFSIELPLQPAEGGA